jgi:hypothetical protein
MDGGQGVEEAGAFDQGDLPTDELFAEYGQVLREAGPIRRARKKRLSKLDEYETYLKNRYEKTV